MKRTKYNDVNEVLELLSSNLQIIIGEKLVAVYLTGSLTYGGFNHGSSDIDFLAVLSEELTNDELKTIEIMHMKIAEKVPYWKKRLEGSYIPHQWLNSINKPRKIRPYINAGIMTMLPYGNEWLLNLYALYEHGYALIGDDPKKIIKPIDIIDVKKASKKNLLEEWYPKIKEENPFIDPNYNSSHLQTYAILTLCRILYLARNDSNVSKKVASFWVKNNYHQWRDLIESVENWQHGINLNKQNETKEFIKFVTKDVGDDSRISNSHKTRI